MTWHLVMDGVYEVSTELGAETWQSCLQELECCQSRQIDRYHTERDLGAKIIAVKGSACDSVANYFQSLHWLEQIVEHCNQDPAWNNNWAQASVDWFQTHTSFDCKWQYAPPYYVDHAYHVDSLKSVVQGLMYIDQDHNAKSTTLFRQHNREVAITTGFDRGWVLLQNGRQEHRGINNRGRARYIFKWNYALQL